MNMLLTNTCWGLQNSILFLKSIHLYRWCSLSVKWMFCFFGDSLRGGQGGQTNYQTWFVLYNFNFMNWQFALAWRQCNYIVWSSISFVSLGRDQPYPGQVGALSYVFEENSSQQHELDQWRGRALLFRQRWVQFLGGWSLQRLWESPMVPRGYSRFTGCLLVRDEGKWQAQHWDDPCFHHRSGLVSSCGEETQTTVEETFVDFEDNWCLLSVLVVCCKVLGSLCEPSLPLLAKDSWKYRSSSNTFSEEKKSNRKRCWRWSRNLSAQLF